MKHKYIETITSMIQLLEKDLRHTEGLGWDGLLAWLANAESRNALTWRRIDVEAFYFLYYYCTVYYM